MKIFTKNRVVTVLLAVGTVALMHRQAQAKALLTGDNGGFFG